METKTFYTLNTDFAQKFVINKDGSISRPSKDSVLMYKPSRFARGKYTTIEKIFPSINNVKTDFASFEFLWNKYSSEYCMTYGEVLVGLQPLLSNEGLDIRLKNPSHYARALQNGLFIALDQLFNMEEFETINDILEEIADRYFLLYTNDFRFELAFKAGEFNGRRMQIAKNSTFNH